MNKISFIKRYGSILALTALLFFTGIVQVSAREYYFSSSQGSNLADGMSEANAKRDFLNVSFSDGDIIYLKSGDVWNEQLSLSEVNGIKIATYGGEECAVIDRKGDVDGAGIVLTNCSDAQISSVCVKNAGAGIVFDYNLSSDFSGINVSGCEFYSIQGRTKFDPASQTEAEGNYRRSAGIEIVGDRAGTISDVIISDCKAYMGDALLFVNVNDAENSLIHSVENLIVKDSYVSGSLTHGIHISGVKNGTLSNCVITDGRPMDYPHGITGIFLAATENFVIDGCEVSYIRNYHDNPDGSGIDIEGNNSNTTISNCNIHHCDGIAVSVYYSNKECKIISNTFYMNDMDNMEKNCIVAGDTKKPSTDILIKDNKWYQMQNEGFEFVKNINPQGDYNIVQENNTELEISDGVVCSQDFDYFPLGGRITGMGITNPELGKSEITGNDIERCLLAQAFGAGYAIGRNLPEMSALTASFKIKLLSGEMKLVMGEAELYFNNSFVTFEDMQYPLNGDWNDLCISLDAKSGKYEMMLNSQAFSGELSGFSWADSIQFIAEDTPAAFLLDDFTVLKGCYKTEFKKRPVVNGDAFNDFAYNGRITNRFAGNKKEKALVISKVIKSGTTITQRVMKFNDTSFCVEINARFIDKAKKEIVINNGEKTYLTLRVSDNMLIASSDTQEKELLSIAESETYKIKLCYDNENLEWTIRINDSVFSLDCQEKVSSDKICFKILPGNTGVMHISGLSANSLGKFGTVKISEEAGEVAQIGVQLIKGENFNGGAYIEDNCLRMYREKTDSISGISGEMKLPFSDNLKGKVKLSFDVLLEKYRMTNHITVYGHNAEGNEVWATALRFTFDSYGRVQYLRNNKETGAQEYANASAVGSTSATRYDYNSFINVVFEIDTDTQTADVYINGVSVVRDVMLINNICDISAIGFRYHTSQTQGMRVKNICFEEFEEGFLESLEDANNFLSVNDGGTVKCEVVNYGERDSVLFEKYSACQKVFRTSEISKNGYDVFTVSGGFVFGKSKGKETALELTDSTGESVLEISVEKGELFVNGEAKKSITYGEEIKLLLAVYNDNKFYLFVDSKELINGELERIPSYYRSGIDFNSSGSFEIRNFENVYYFENCVRVVSNYTNNINSDTLYSYKNVHFLGNDARNNVNVDFVR